MTKEVVELAKQVQLLATQIPTSQNATSVETCGICGEYGHGANISCTTFKPTFNEFVQANVIQVF